MRILLLVVALAAVALFALPASPVSPVAPSTAFAAEVSGSDAVPVADYCYKFCHGSPGSQYCSFTPGTRNGCHHINLSGNCIFTLCPINPPPDPEVVE